MTYEKGKGIEHKWKVVIEMMDMTFKLGCKKIESMNGRINGIWFCGSKIFGMREPKR